MVEYVSVRSNWSSINSISLDLVCDIDFEERNQSTIMMEKREDEEQQQQQQQNSRVTTSSDENVSHVILRANEEEKQDEPMIILSILQPDAYYINSVQFLSNARHIEFYHQEYLGTCQASRITELDSESIYESIFQFNQSYREITFKCLKLADTTDLIVYCLQISLTETKGNTSSISMKNLPFDLNRVRSMIDESNLSTNARQFMKDLQHIQDRKQSSQQLNLGQMMAMMQGMTSSSANSKSTSSPTTPTSIVHASKSSLTGELTNVVSQDNDKMKDEFTALETRLQIYIDKRFLQLQEHIDERFNRLEEKLIHSNG